ncbi:MAG: hypothetical protein WB679_05355 [Terracidiphilus sp.]
MLSAEEFIGWCRDQLANGQFPVSNLGIKPEVVKAVLAVESALVPVCVAEKEAAQEADALALVDQLNGGGSI